MLSVGEVRSEVVCDDRFHGRPPRVASPACGTAVGRGWLRDT